MYKGLEENEGTSKNDEQIKIYILKEFDYKGKRQK